MVLVISIILIVFILLFLAAWFWYFKNEANAAKKFYNHGFVEFQDKAYSKAISFFKKAVEAKPDFKDALCWLGLSYLEIKDWQKAKESFEKALKLNPKDFNALFNIALILQAQNSYDQAREFYNRALKENSKNHDCYFKLGQMDFDENNVSQALEFFQKAHELSPNNASISFYIAKCKEEECRYDSMEEGQSVIEEYLKVTALEKIPPLFEITLAKAYAKAGQIDMSLECCKKALAKDDADVESYNILGLLQLLKSNPDEAKNTLSTAISLESSNEDAHNILSYALCRHEDRCIAEKCRLKYKKIVKKQ